jgi:SAM-dependent methyltransferase
MEKEEYQKMYDIEEENWWFSSKRRMVGAFLKKCARKDVLLDVGCGTGSTLQALGRGFEKAIGCDASKEALMFSRKRGLKLLLRSNAEELPLKDGSVDALLALDLIEHVEDDSAAMAEFCRVLKKGGSLFLTAPAFGFLWSAKDAVLHHKRRYKKEELKRLLLKNGFEIRKLSYWNFAAFHPVLLSKALGRSRPDAETGEIPNKILKGVLSVENFLLKRMNFPYGVSVFAEARKR